MTAEQRHRDDVDDLTDAIEFLKRVRQRHQEGMIQPPDRDSTLAKAEYHLRGARDESLEELGLDPLAYVREADDE